MRLFAKFFLCSTLVICIALLLSGYMLITTSYESSISREVERANIQYQFDKFTVQARFIANTEALNDELPHDFFRALAADLNGLAAFFTYDKTLLYSDLPPDTDFSILEDVSDNVHVHSFQEVGASIYIMVSGRVVQSDISLYMLIATDISDIIAQRDYMTQSFVNVYVITLLVSMFVILIFSALLTRPLKRINSVAAKIAQGDYNNRLPISSSGDEIGELSNSFNQMTDAIEGKISELSENARQKEDFVANFAHELKTPLTSVIGYADMLYQKTLSPEQTKNAAWYILNEGLRLEALSLKLMDLIVLNRQDFVLEEMPADELLFNVLGSIKPMLEEKKVILRPDIEQAFIMVEYDLFKTLLLNLIDNAIKAEGTNIRISGKINDDKYLVSVSDNGRGIAESELNRITEAFYTVDKSRSRKQHSAGLGLSLASKIAEIHGCALEINSIVGIGTTIEFSLRVRH